MIYPGLYSMDPRRATLPGAPPLIQFPGGPPAVPMLQPGALGQNNENGIVYGQFPDANVSGQDGRYEPPGAIEEVPMGPPGTMEEVGAGAGGGISPLAKGALGKLLSAQGLATVGVALSGLGPQQFQNPVLQRMVLQQAQQKRQGEGLGRVFEAMSASSRAPDPVAALQVYDAARTQYPEIQNDPAIFKTYLEHRSRLAEQAYKAGVAGRVSSILGALPEGWTQEDARDALGAIPVDEQTEKRLAGRPKRYLDAETGNGQKVRIDTKSNLVRAFGDAGDWAKTITLGGIAYTVDPKTKELVRMGGVISGPPGEVTSEVGPDGTLRTISEIPSRQPITPAAGEALVGLGYTVAEIQKALGDPTMRTAALGVLDEANQRARVTEGAPKPSFEAWALFKSANPGATYRQFLDRFAPAGLPELGPAGTGASEAQNYMNAQQRNRVEVSAQQGAAGLVAKTQAAQGLRIGEEGAKQYVTAEGRYVKPHQTQQEIDDLSKRGEVAFVPFQFDREIIVRTKPLLGELDRIEAIVDRRPDLFPKSAGTAADLLSTTLAKTKANWTSSVDPDVAAIKKATAPYGALLNRFSGDSGNTALPERVANLAALGAEPATQEVAKRMIQELRQTISDNLSSYGLDPQRFGVGRGSAGAPSTPGFALPSGKSFR